MISSTGSFRRPNPRCRAAPEGAYPWGAPVRRDGVPPCRTVAGMIENVAEHAGRSQEPDERPDPPRFEAEGRPQGHDFFADGEVIRLRLFPDYVPARMVSAVAIVGLHRRLDTRQLLGELISWQEEFSQNFHWEKGGDPKR